MPTVPVLVLLALASAVSSCRIPPAADAPARPDRVVMGYYPSWSRDAFDHTKIAYANLTHIAHAFAWPDAEGNLVVPAELPYPALNAAAHAAGVKMIISLGGGGHCAGFPGMSSSAAARSRFIAQVVGFCEANAYDGVDLDWEYPSNDSEKAGFTLLAEALGAALKARSPALLLTMAAPAEEFHGRWIDLERLAGVFDHIGLMTYGYHGAWSDHSGHNAPLYASRGDPCGSLDRSFLYARGRRVPAGKILVGLPFFGRSFDCGGLGAPFTAVRNWEYRDVAALPGAEWARRWDADAQVPWKRRADGAMIITYDDPGSVSLKCQYVKDRAAGGVIVWALGGDHRDGASELLEVVGRSFGVR